MFYVVKRGIIIVTIFIHKCKLVLHLRTFVSLCLFYLVELILLPDIYFDSVFFLNEFMR